VGLKLLWNRHYWSPFRIVSGEPMQPACEIVAISRHSFYIGPWVKCLKIFCCESSYPCNLKQTYFRVSNVYFLSDFDAVFSLDSLLNYLSVVCQRIWL
jgi:hypothetical protein